MANYVLELKMAAVHKTNARITKLSQRDPNEPLLDLFREPFLQRFVFCFVYLLLLLNPSLLRFVDLSLLTQTLLN
jgi:hypothetical protein